ncbi:hypothetical protein [Neisseria sp.]|uniref:hypothetical protein n=1 Tax=Neisseria sp. TaxID=192066 RepID=UPI0035A16045
MYGNGKGSIVARLETHPLPFTEAEKHAAATIKVFKQSRFSRRDHYPFSHHGSGFRINPVRTGRLKITP